MCYSSEQQYKIDFLEFRYKVKKRYPVGLKDEELTYYHANGYAHPWMPFIPQENKVVLTAGRWGLMPSKEKGVDPWDYYKKAARYGAGLNAQSEKVFDHFIYKYSIFEKRCIIPFSAFHEPHTTPTGNKVPFHFERKDGDVLSMAGIYTVTSDGYPTFTILTKEATPLFAKIHNSKKRRTVVLTKETEKIWLSDSHGESEIQEIIDNDLPDSEFKAYPISKDIYSPKVNSNRKDISKPVDYPGLTIDY